MNPTMMYPASPWYVPSPMPYPNACPYPNPPPNACPPNAYPLGLEQALAVLQQKLDALEKRAPAPEELQATLQGLQNDLSQIKAASSQRIDNLERNLGNVQEEYQQLRTAEQNMEGKIMTYLKQERAKDLEQHQALENEIQGVTQETEELSKYVSDSRGIFQTMRDRIAGREPPKPATLSFRFSGIL